MKPATAPKRIKLSPITIHPNSEKVIQRVKNERAIPTGQAIDILLRDLEAAQRRVKELEARLTEATRMAAHFQ